MFKKILFAIIIFISLCFISLIATGHAYILTGISRTYLQGNNTANIDDYTTFKTRDIKASESIPWKESEVLFNKSLPEEFLNDLAINDGVAFLVAHKGEIVAENYFAGYDDRSKTNSFSMSKTVVALLLGKAIDEGYIKSFDQKITDFIPEFKDKITGEIPSIGSFCTMTSGYVWEENYYSPFSPTVELMYGSNVEDFVLERNIVGAEKDEYYYSSASTQILTIAITRALQAKNPKANLSDYLSDKFWQPLGMNDNAVWHLDNNEMELGFCCINTNARNFAKIGQLMLQNGNYNNKQLLDSTFVYQMSQPKYVGYYGYATWINTTYDIPYYLFRGYLGQYIIVVPSKELVLVRLGKTRGSAGDENIDMVLDGYVTAAIELIEN